MHSNIAVVVLLLTAIGCSQSAPSLMSSVNANQKTTSSGTAALSVSDLVPQEYAFTSNNPWPSSMPSSSTQKRRATEAITSSGEVFPSGYDQMPSPSDTKSSDAFVMKPMAEEKQQPMMLPPADGVVPKMTGGFVKSEEEKWASKLSQKDGPGAIVNPAAYYLEGANVESIKAPKCQMIACDGPMPNDFDFSIQQEDPSSPLRSDKACHQTFVPLNGCIDGRGYPMGMVCTICCDCNADFKTQMVKSRGYVQGYKSS